MPTNPEIPGVGKDRILAKVEHVEYGEQRHGAPLAAMLAWGDRLLPCRIVRISPAGAKCVAALTPPLGAYVILRHSMLGSAEAVVARHDLTGFVLAFERDKAAAFALKAAMLAMTAPMADDGQYIGQS